MNILDIILAIPLVYAVYKGFKDGVIAQLGGLAGVIAGIWLAINFSAEVGAWLGIYPDFATEAAFVLIILASIIVLGIAGWLIGKIFNAVGLGMFNWVCGVVVALIKMAFILSVLLTALGAINKRTGTVEQEYLDNSLLYKPVSSLSRYILPSMQYIKNTFSEDGER